MIIISFMWNNYSKICHVYDHSQKFGGYFMLFPFLGVNLKSRFSQFLTTSFEIDIFFGLIIKLFVIAFSIHSSCLKQTDLIIFFLFISKSRYVEDRKYQLWSKIYKSNSSVQTFFDYSAHKKKNPN